MPVIKIRDTDIYYECHGCGDPLVLVAGFSCDHTFWGAMLPALAVHFEVLIFDNRAVGRTRDKGEAFTIDALAEDTVLLSRALGMEKAHFVGHSMGGTVVQAIAGFYPDAVNRLVIMNSAAVFNERTLRAIRSLVQLGKAGVSVDLLLDAAMPWFFSPRWLKNPDHCAAFRKMILSNPYPQSFEDQARQLAALDQFDSTSWLHQMTSPALVISSEDDIVDLPEEGRVLAAQLSNAQFVLLPGGHSSPLEQPQLAAQAVKNFLIAR